MITGLVGKAAVIIVGLTFAGTAVLTTGLQATASPTLTPTPLANRDIPVGYLRDYQSSAAACPGLDWTILAGVGKVESDHGRTRPLTSPTGAQGPMQFEPATWARYGVDADGDGKANPFDPADAILAAADYLCTLAVTRNPSDALIAYNCGNTGPACQAASAGYAALVLSWAARYGRSSDPTTVGGAAALAIRTALAQVDTPYLWGGESTAGFDCSGLVQWSYARAGISLPRVAQDQYDAGPRVPAGTPLTPGDLVFFGSSSPFHVQHVGIYLGNDRMVDAPHTGAFVRVEPITGFDPPYLGATAPAQGPVR